MIVYYLTLSEFALRLLRDRQLVIARINELNDPFQLCAADFSDSDLKTFKNQPNECYGVICFSKSYQDPVLWSHYEIPSAGLASFQLKEQKNNVCRIFKKPA